MINLLSIEIKRILNKKSFIFIFCILLVLSIFSMVNFKNNIKVDYSVDISIIDNDKSEESSIFIKKLKSNPAINISQNNQNDETSLNDMIKKSKINAGIIIPKDFFKNLPNSKIELIYSELDALAPALIDIISQDFIGEVCKVTIKNKIANQYSKNDAIKAEREFNKLKNSDKFDLEIIKEPFNSLSGLKESFKIDDINSLKSVFMYICTFNLLFVSLSLQIFRSESKNLIKRLRVSGSAHRTYYITMNFVSHIIFIIVPLIASTLSLFILKMNFLPFLYFLFSTLVVSLVIFEILNFISSIIKDDNISFTSNVILIILLSLVGGAFFSIDIMPDFFVKVASISPFYIISDTFYKALDSDYSSTIIIFVYLLLFFLLNICNLSLYSKKE